MNDDSEKQSATWIWIFNVFFNEKKEFFRLHHLHSQNLEFIKALNVNWGILFSIFFLLFPLLFRIKGILRLYKIEIYILKTDFPYGIRRLIFSIGGENKSN